MNVFQEIEAKIYTSINAHLTTLRSTIRTFDTRHRRGLFPGIGRLISGLTSVAHQDDLTDIRHLITKMANAQAHAVQTWTTGSNTFMSALHIENNRINNLAEITKVQQRTMDEFLPMFLRDHVMTHQSSNMTAHALRHLITFTETLDDISVLQSAISTLLNGRLPYTLVTTSELTTALGELQQHVQQTRPDLTALYTKPSYYYQHAKLTVTRHNNQLIILLHVPLTLRQFASSHVLYDVTTFPLLVPQNSQYSLIQLDTQTVIYHRDSDIYIPFKHRQMIPDSDTLDVRAMHVYPRQKTHSDCLIALLEGTPAVIKTACHFTITVKPLPPQVIRLAKSRIFISGIEAFTLTCNSTNTTVTSPQQQFVYEIPCACTVYVQFMVLSSDHDTCTQHHDNFTHYSYPINLRLLHEFFDELDQFDIQPDTLSDSHIDVLLPHIAVEQSKVQQLIANEDAAQFDLETLVNQTKNDADSYASLSHYILEHFSTLDSTLSTSDWTSYIIWISLAASLFALASTSMLARKLHVLSLLLGARPATADRPRYRVLPTAFVFRPSTTTVTHTINVTTPEPLTFTTAVQTYLPIELIATLLGVIIIIAIIAFCCRRQRNNPQTTLKLFIGSLQRYQQYVELTWFILPQSIVAYELRLDGPNSLTVKPTEWPHPFTEIETSFTDFTIMHRPTQMFLDYPTKFKAPWFRARQLQQILSSNSYYIQLIAYNKELDDILCMNLTHHTLHVQKPNSTEMQPLYSAPHEPPRPIPEAPPTLYPTLPQ